MDLSRQLTGLADLAKTRFKEAAEQCSLLLKAAMESNGEARITSLRLIIDASKVDIN